MARIPLLVAFALFYLDTLAEKLQREPAPKQAKVYFIQPKDGDTVGRKFKVVFGLSEMGVAPAGVEKQHTGHHHLLVNKIEPASYDLPLPNDDNHRHFGGGQTETWITLSPGQHTLRLLLADHRHIPHQPPIQSPLISITVK